SPLMKKQVMITLPFLLLAIITGCNVKKTKMEKEFRDFIERFETTVAPLQKDANLAYWNASISGEDEDYAIAQKHQIALNNFFTNKEDFQFLKSVKESGGLEDTLLQRQLEVLYNAYLS